ncbi:MAG: hypothetical protein FWG52_10165 [Proteobacteria bacterium]|nr:hypothetical protein [Pseudomonadota bacterium]
MKRHTRNTPKSTLIRLLATQAVKDYMNKQQQQRRGVVQNSSNRIVPIKK